MTQYLQRILENKRLYRVHLARLSIAQKLAMLDELRERTLTIRRAVEKRDAQNALLAAEGFTKEPICGCRTGESVDADQVVSIVQGVVGEPKEREY